MADDEVNKSPATVVFDATSLVKELRSTVISGKTKTYEWRVSQLNSLLKMVEDRDKEICDALFSDLSKPEMEAFIHEVCFII